VYRRLNRSGVTDQPGIRARVFPRRGAEAMVVSVDLEARATHPG